jgi:hypothetical protein
LKKKGRVYYVNICLGCDLKPFTAAQAEKDLSIFIGKVDISSFDLTE